MLFALFNNDWEIVAISCRVYSTESYVISIGGHLGVQGVQNVPRSVWVKTDAASKTANATCVETQNQFLPTRCEVQFVLPVPPGVHLWS